MKDLVKITGLTKDFGDGKGTFDLNFQIAPGQIVGFVGPNGAGKSTTINMLAGLAAADKGRIELLGHVITMQNIYRQMPRLGILLSEPTLEKTITARQAFRESEALLGITSGRWQAMAETLALDIHKPIETLSLGNKKKVGVILALMHQPDVAIMDEPTSGLDPLIQSKFSALLREQTARGSSVFLSSHDLSEIQDICDRVIMIKAGRIIIDQPIKHLLEKSARTFVIKNPPEALVRKLHDSAWGKHARQTALGFTLHTSEYRKMIDFLTGQKFYNFYIESPGLEEMFAEYYR